MKTNVIYKGEAKKVLSSFEDESVNMAVTSPPYWGLRDYGVEGQLGLEDTPEQYVERLVNIFKEVNRVLRGDGTLWLNLGDSYASGGTMGASLKQKDLVGIPWRVAFALQEDGWYLRNDIIWHKPNPMPESVKDRCTTSHEHIFLLAKSKKYYFNQENIKEPMVGQPHKPGNKKLDISRNDHNQMQKVWGENGMANKRSVWKVTTKPFSEAHFAVYPPDLIRPCIKAGCPDDGIVLDPFMGAGTSALVALQEGKQFVGVELSQDYIDIAHKRIGEFDKSYYDELPEDKKPEQDQLF